VRVEVLLRARFVCAVLGLGGLILGSVVACTAIGFGFWAVDEFSDLDFPLLLLIVAPWVALASGVWCGWFWSRWYSRRVGLVWKPGRRTRIVVWVLAGLYLVTWALGAPSAQNECTRWALEEWRVVQQHEGSSGLNDGLPRVQTFAAIPILPFVIASYHEYQIAGLFGAGGWDVRIWYFVGTKRLYFLRLWIS
jgi:hypothetical protein